MDDYNPNQQPDLRGDKDLQNFFDDTQDSNTKTEVPIRKNMSNLAQKNQELFNKNNNYK